jgi:hypothetical protein
MFCHSKCSCFYGDVSSLSLQVEYIYGKVMEMLPERMQRVAIAVAFDSYLYSVHVLSPTSVRRFTLQRIWSEVTIFGVL